MVLKAATAVGHTCYGDPRPETLNAAVEGLFEVATNKAEDIQFAAGEALCHVFGGDDHRTRPLGNAGTAKIVNCVRPASRLSCCATQIYGHHPGSRPV